MTLTYTYGTERGLITQSKLQFAEYGRWTYSVVFQCRRPMKLSSLGLRAQFFYTEA
jgi:hypothetical protein